jgi:hypothetical protein
MPRQSKLTAALVVFCLSGSASAAVDSSATLFADGTVRTYTLHFYDAKWDSLMQADYASGAETYRPARFSDGTLVLDTVGVRYKGNSSYAAAANSPKKPLKISFGAFRTQTYFGEKTLNFSNCNGDPTMMREKLSYDLIRAYDVAPRAGFAVVSVDSVQLGLYTQVEQVDKTFLKRWFTLADSNLFKAGDDGSPLAYLGDSASAYDTGGLYELKTNEKADDWSGFVTFLKLLDKDSTPDAAFATRWPAFLDGDNVARHLAFDMVLSNFDSYIGSGRNFYLYQTSAAGAMRIIPWDLNLSFGAFTNGWNVYTLDPLSQTNLASRPLCARVLGNDSLKTLYLGWIRRLIHERASTDSVQAAATRLASVIRPFVGRDPNKFYDSAAFESNVESKYYLDARKTTSIPGLLEFSRTRNANLLAAIQSVLGQDAVSSRAPIPSWSLVRSGSRWILSGPAGALAYSLHRLDGATLRTTSLPEFSGKAVLDLPSGISLLRLRGATTTRSILVQNIPTEVNP